MRTLYDENKAKGFSVLGFPCNQFGSQEPGSNEEILDFVRSKYDVDFPMFAKIEVNGEGACDLYNFLKHGHPDEEGNEDIAWNFTKFLIGRDGSVLARCGPTTTPEELAEMLQQYL